MGEVGGAQCAMEAVHETPIPMEDIRLAQARDSSFAKNYDRKLTQERTIDSRKTSAAF